MKQRLSIDPLADLGVEKRLLYLQRVCASLPPPGSENREKLRKEHGLASVNTETFEDFQIFDLDTYVQHSRTQL